MILSWGHLYLTYNTKCARSPGEAIPNNEIFRRLAARLGFEEENFKWTGQRVPGALRRLVRRRPARASTCEYLREHGFARLKVGTPDDRAAAQGRQLPDADRQVHASSRRRQELRRRSVPPDVRRLPAGRTARSRSPTTSPSCELARYQPRAGQAVSRSISSRPRATASSTPATPTWITRSKVRASSSS